MIANYSVKKPYTVLVGVILVIVIGVVSLSRMVTDLLPDMSFPYVLVITVDPGATPEEVEKEVTAPIEAALASTTSIKSLSSVSNNNYSLVILEYEQSTNMDSRMIEIQQSLDLVSAGFKDTIGSPNILQINPDMIPVMAVAVSYEGMEELELKRFVDNELASSFESVEGAASVNVVSSVGDEIVRITLDEDKIKELNKKLESEIKKEFDKAKSEINSGKSKIDEARKEMTSGTAQLSEALNKTLSTKEELITQKAELIKQKEELVKQKAMLDEQLPALIATIDGIMQNPFYESMKEMPVDETLKAALSAMGIEINTYGDLPAAKEQVAAIPMQLEMGIAMIDEGLKQIDSGEATLENVLSTLNANASIAALQIGIGSGSLAEAAAGINSAKGQIESAETEAISKTDLEGILSVDTIGGIVMAQNFDMPAGYVSDNEMQYMIRVSNPITELDQIDDLVLMDMGFDEVGIIKLSDVANVEVITEDVQSYAIVNGNPGVLVSMQKQTGYSTGEASKNLKKSFEQLRNEYEGLHIDILMDQSVYIDIIVKSVLQNIILGAILACIVLFVFLKSFRPTIIIALSIPLSVMVAIIAMYFMDISLNIISLSGLALGIGMLVDNSIVAVENIFRLRAEGYSIEEAAVKGVNEIAGAITASTLTTVSVYAPIIFTEGLTRQLFVDIALTILFTLMASLITALTIVPAMSKGLLKGEIKEQSDKFVSFLSGYKKLLSWSLNHKLITFVVSIAILISSGLACYARGLDFLDMEVEADQLSATVASPEGKEFDFETLTERTDEVLESLEGIEGIETIGAMGGGNSAISFMGGGDGITLYIVLSEDNKRSLSEISEEIKERTKDIDADVSVTTDSSDYTSFFASGISVDIKGKNIDKLQELSKEIGKTMEGVEGISEVDDGTEDAQPEFRITVDREAAAKYSYTVAQVFQLVAGKLASTTSATSVNIDPIEYDIYIETEEQSDVELSDIENMTFEYTDKEGEKTNIHISEICSFEKTTTLSRIRRSGQKRVVSVTGTVKDGYNVTLVANEIRDRLESIEIPDGYEVDMTGEDETIRDAMEQMLLMMLLAIIFIYLIMVAQFQSLKSPFIIMFTIPLAFTGGFLALLITGKTLNVIAMLGFVMLAGLIVNNGIVLIDYINRLREEGMDKREAIINAGMVRTRPVFMTVLTTVLSVSTIALGIGKGSVMMQPMAIVIIGGLVYGTLLTLVIVPCVYDVFHLKEN